MSEGFVFEDEGRGLHRVGEVYDQVGFNGEVQERDPAGGDRVHLKRPLHEQGSCRRRSCRRADRRGGRY